MARKRSDGQPAPAGTTDTLNTLGACFLVVARLLDLVRERHPSVPTSPGCRPFELTPEVDEKLTELADLLGK